MKTSEEIEKIAEKEMMGMEGRFGFVAGYEKCQEDMADKKYTEEDLREAISLARKTKVNVFGANGEESIGFVHSNNEILKIIVNKQD
jgi:hypothetical protein